MIIATFALSLALCMFAFASVGHVSRRTMKSYRQSCRDYDAYCDWCEQEAKAGRFHPPRPVPVIYPYYFHQRGQPIP